MFVEILFPLLICSDYMNVLVTQFVILHPKCVVLSTVSTRAPGQIRGLQVATILIAKMTRIRQVKRATLGEIIIRTCRAQRPKAVSINALLRMQSVVTDKRNGMPDRAHTFTSKLYRDETTLPDLHPEYVRMGVRWSCSLVNRMVIAVAKSGVFFIVLLSQFAMAEARFPPSSPESMVGRYTCDFLGDPTIRRFRLPCPGRPSYALQAIESDARTPAYRVVVLLSIDPEAPKDCNDKI